MGNRAHHYIDTLAPSASSTSNHHAPPELPGTTAGKGSLVEQLIGVRKADRLSVKSLAEMSGVSAYAIRKMEAGEGPVATLVAVLDALPFHVAGLAEGGSFVEQLRNRRARCGLSLETIAARASLLPDEVLELEAGAGAVDQLLALLAIIAPQLRRRAPERVYWGAGNKLDRDSRFTRHGFMVPVYDAFGEVDLDPCGHPQSPVIARRRFLLGRGDDGLTMAWSGRLAFMNPPYSAQLKWLRRAHEQWQAGNVETVVCLVPARMDSAFFHETIVAHADVFVLRGRVKFLDLDGKAQATPFSLMVVVFGVTLRQKARFAALVPGFWASADTLVEAACHSVALQRTSRGRRVLCGGRSRALLRADCKPLTSPSYRVSPM